MKDWRLCSQMGIETLHISPTVLTWLRAVPVLFRALRFELFSGWVPAISSSPLDFFEGANVRLLRSGRIPAALFRHTGSIGKGLVFTFESVEHLIRSDSRRPVTQCFLPELAQLFHSLLTQGAFVCPIPQRITDDFTAGSIFATGNSITDDSHHLLWQRNTDLLYSAHYLLPDE